MKIYSNFLAPRHRLNVMALSIAASAVVVAGCGPQQPAAPSQPVAMVPTQSANTGGAQPQPQPQANLQYLPGQQGQAQPVPGQPLPMQGQPMAQAPSGYAAAPQRYAPATAQPVPPAAPVYQDAPPPTLTQAYPQPTYMPEPAPKPRRQTVASPAPVHVASNHVGRVASIEPIHERPQGSGAGGVMGGVLGAVVGNQFGHGNGRAALTVLGGVGGAVAGNQVERSVRERVVGYRINVVLDDGGSRTYEESSTEGLRVGDRVRVEGNGLRRI